MDIALTEALERYLREQVKSGLYADASDVVREALRQKIAAEGREQAKLEALRAAIDEADADLEAGRFDEYGPDYLDRLDRSPTDHAAE